MVLKATYQKPFILANTRMIDGIKKLTILEQYCCCLHHNEQTQWGIHQPKHS